ncbi:MAG TPA: hypothetical protein VFD58_37525 [Blastocatellia bacterium]|nr:hypothetical protein [Blastocatellia bacterium]
MRTSHKLTSLLLSLVALVVLSMSALAADPGLVPGAASSIVSDQKAGSVLIYNVYTSSLSNPGAENTRINITNTSSADVFVHLFFVDGSTCSVADSFICLTGNQTTTFNMSDTDPGVMGFVVAVATNAAGCPIVFNSLIGDEYVKFLSGHAANLGAEAVSAITAPPCDPATASAVDLLFNNVQYGALPRVLADDHIMSRGDGNDTLLIINRLSGSLVSGISTSSLSLFGLLFDPLENPFSFTFTMGCQFKQSIGAGTFPRTTPRFSTLIGPGSYAWAKFWATSDVPLLGAAINFNPNALTNQNAFNGGHNLHKLTYSTAGVLTIPVFTAFCS